MDCTWRERGVKEQLQSFQLDNEDGVFSSNKGRSTSRVDVGARAGVQTGSCEMEMIIRQSCGDMEKAPEHANTESGEQSRLAIQNLGVFRACVVFKVTGLNEVTRSLNIEKFYMSEVRDDFMKGTGVMLGMLGHLEFDLARRKVNASTISHGCEINVITW